MKRVLCVFLAAALFFTGCTALAPNEATVHYPSETVDNIFSQNPTSSTSPTAPTVPPAIELGQMKFGVDCERQNDGKSHYLAYEGGQMHMPFHIKATGLVSTYDMGIMIFIDGVAQPYRVGPDGEYAYMHSFSQEDGVLGSDQFLTTIADIYLTPITGNKGDMLELYAVAMPNPDYLPSQGAIAFAHTIGSLVFETRLKYNAAPSEETYPEKIVRLLDVSIFKVDCTAEDVKFWTDVDLIKNQRIAFTANGGEDYIYGVDEDDRVTLRFEVWGSPYVHYGLVFFVDNKPVYTADLADIWVTVEMGQKTVVEATLDMTGFSEESVVYAMLVPRNYYTSEIETSAHFRESATIYLLAKGNRA